MKFDKKSQNYTLSTGKSFYANCGMLSLSENLFLHNGYDGETENQWSFKDNEPPPETFTKEEKREIANFIIAQFNKWVEK